MSYTKLCLPIFLQEVCLRLLLPAMNYPITKLMCSITCLGNLQAQASSLLSAEFLNIKWCSHSWSLTSYFGHWLADFCLAKLEMMIIWSSSTITGRRFAHKLTSVHNSQQKHWEQSSMLPNTFINYLHLSRWDEAWQALWLAACWFMSSACVQV